MRFLSPLPLGSFFLSVLLLGSTAEAQDEVPEASPSVSAPKPSPNDSVDLVLPANPEDSASKESASQESEPVSFDEMLPVACGMGKWELRGAQAKPDDEVQASYLNEWDETLEAVKLCLESEKLARACLNIRGHYDSLEFDASVVRAFGSMDAAQTTRARGRSVTIVTRLYEMGVESNRLREVPPPSEETFRGVSIELVQACLPGAPVSAPVEERPLPPPVDVEAIAQQAAERVVAEQEAQKPLPVKNPNQIWLQPQVNVAFARAEQTLIFNGLVGGGFGWQNRDLYLRLQADIGFGVPESQQSMVEGRFAAGVRLMNWLEVGLTTGAGLSMRNFNDPWFQRHWFVGLEATECLWSWLGEENLCLYQALSPLGQQQRRVTLVDAQPFSSTTNNSYYIRVDLGFSIRFQLL